jgi:hypothetical protein
MVPVFLLSLLIDGEFYFVLFVSFVVNSLHTVASTALVARRKRRMASRMRSGGSTP